MTVAGGGAAIAKAENKIEFGVKCRRGSTAQPGWVPSYVFNAMGFDLNGGWDPSVLKVLDFCARTRAHAMSTLLVRTLLEFVCVLYKLSPTPSRL